MNSDAACCAPTLDAGGLRLIITRGGEQSVVMLALEDFKAFEETGYLLRSPTNARRLLTAMQELEAGKGKVRKLAK